MSESPAKKLSFEPTGKENIESLSHNVDDFELKKPVTEVIKTEEKLPVAPTIKPEEADEPLLRENPHRFVLFPIKYHEVSVATDASRVKWFRDSRTNILFSYRSGRCTRRPRHHSGQLRRLISPRTCTTGTIA